MLCLILWMWAMVSCSGTRYQEIIVPELTGDFYEEALLEIDKKIKRDSKNPNLIEQKIFYCERLGWPVGCIDGLDQYQSLHGMSNQLVDQYMAYYLTNNEINAIVGFINRWDKEYKLSDKYRQPLIQGLVANGENKLAIQHIRKLLRDSDQNKELLAFVSDQFLQMTDTLMAAYYLGKLAKKDSSNHLMVNYGKILYELGLSDKGDKILTGYYQLQPDNKALALDLAVFYREYNATQKARNMIKPYAAEDTLSYFLSDLYVMDFYWDSALMYLDTILLVNSGSIRALKNKGSIYEKRGWLSNALSMFEQAQALDSTDTSIASSISLIRRKIAYLQRQKFEESKVPLLEIESKKIEN